MGQDPEDEFAMPMAEVDDLLLACLEVGEDQRESVLEELCSEHPDHAEDLRFRLECLGFVGFLPERAETVEKVPDRFGEFRILRKLGGGGMGIVYLAEQEGLGRRVALKLLRPDVLLSATARERFRREGVTLSRLEHPGICPVFEVGDVDGVPYIAMRYLEGQTLAERIRTARENRASDSGSDSGSERRRVLELVKICERVARALHVAHEAGLVHRDVKPGNVILTADGQPVILDFGLARDAAGDDALTLSGDTLGTPAYMAPEQVEGKATDRRTDVYGLGVTLYECLMLARPFTADSRETLYREVLSGAPARLRLPFASRDLEVLTRKAIECDPNHRYDTALEFAEDLRRFREHEPIAARPAGVALRTRRWVQRNPAVAAFVALLTAALVAMSVLLVVLSDSLRRSEESFRRSQSLRVADRSKRISGQDAKASLWLALESLEMYPSVEARSQVYASLGRQYQLRRFDGHEDVVESVHFSPVDSTQVLSTSWDGTAKIWDRVSGDVAFELRGQEAITDAKFDATGSRISSVSALGTVHERSSAGETLRTFGKRGGSGFGRVVVSPDGKKLVAAGEEGGLLCDLETGREIRLSHPGRNREACFSPDSRVVATAIGYGLEDPEVEDFTVRFWDARTGDPLPGELRHERCIMHVEFSADGDRILTVSKDKTVGLWDWATRKRIKPIRCTPGEIWCAAFQPATEKGRQCFATGSLKLLRLYGPNGDQLWEWPIGFTYKVEFAPDGQSLIASVYDGTAKVFSLDGKLIRELIGHENRVNHAVFSHDGRLVATAGWDYTVRVWEAGGSSVLKPLGPLGRFAEVGPGGTVVVKDGDAPGVRVCTSDGNEYPIDRRLAQRPEVRLAHPRFDRKGERILITTADQQVEVYDLRANRLHEFSFRRSTENAPREQCIAEFLGADRVIVARGNRLSVRSLDGAVAGVDRIAFHSDSTLDSDASIGDIAAHPDGERFAVAWVYPHEVSLHDAKTGRTLATFDGHGDKTIDVSFSPYGRKLATACLDRFVRIFSVSAPKANPIELLHEAKVHCATFSPNGEWVASAAHDGTVRIWLVDGREWARIRTDRKNYWRVTWTPDGEWVWTTGGWRFPATKQNLFRLARQRSVIETESEKAKYERLLNSVLEGR